MTDPDLATSRHWSERQRSRVSCVFRYFADAIRLVHEGHFAVAEDRLDSARMYVAGIHAAQRLSEQRRRENARGGTLSAGKMRFQ